ncbi:NADH-quinone oxidoreductase subunit J, partial [Francisella tularensis subsp. holarctica]|nr:NADH-quinone oxidoreductase subunit J [Francisella tularensis subsp. holarctica]
MVVTDIFFYTVASLAIIFALVLV